MRKFGHIALASLFLTASAPALAEVVNLTNSADGEKKERGSPL